MDTRIVLSGRYELRSRLGHGGVSQTWHARDLILNRDVAVKMIGSLDLDNHPESVATARVTHPHVAKVFDYGEAELEAGRRTTFVVMELLHGTPLSEVSTPMPPRLALQIGAGIAAALAAAHAQGVIHCDVKPGNVMLTRGGVKILDFGIGTTGMASSDEGQGTDIYALGLLMYGLLTQQAPSPPPTEAADADGHLLDEPTELAASDGVSDDVVSLCRRCLAGNPAERPAASEVARVLSEAAGAPADRTLDEPLLHADYASGLDLERNADTVQMAPVGIGGTIMWSPRRHRITRDRWKNAGLLLAMGTVAIMLAYAFVDATASYRWRLPSTSAVDLDRGSVVAPPRPPQVPPRFPPEGLNPPFDEATAPSTPVVFAGPRVLITYGGEVVADCQDSQAVLLAWAPKPSFKTKKIVAGPADSAGLRFQDRGARVDMTVTCHAGVPAAQISQRDPVAQRRSVRPNRPE